jgi:hypothetical protein
MAVVPASALSIALAGLLALAAQVGEAMVVVVIVLVQVLVALAPAPADDRGRIVRAPRFETALLAGLAATVLTVWPRLFIGAPGSRVDGVGSVGSGTFAGLIVAAAVGVVVALASQMLRRDDRRALVSSTGYAVTVAMFAALPIGWLTAFRSFGGADVVVVCAAAVAAAMAAWMLPIGHWQRATVAIVVAAGGGGLVAVFLSSYLSWQYGVTIGLAVGAFAVLGRVLGAAWGTGRRHAAAGWGLPGALSLVLAAPVVHVAGLLSSSL